jgi:hypothetical protein
LSDRFLAYADPSAAVRRLYRTARRALDRALAAKDLELAQDEAAMALIMAVACADAFLTAQALDLALDNPKNYRRILSDIKARKPLDVKLATWPILLFGRTLPRGDYSIDDLLGAKARRNSLLHGIGDQALADNDDQPIGLGLSAQVHPLELGEAERALGACLWLVSTVLRARGMTNAQVIEMRRLWLGIGRKP